MKPTKYPFGQNFVNSYQVAWNLMHEMHPNESMIRPSVDFLWKLHFVMELSAKLYYEYIDEDIYQGEMEKMFSQNQYIPLYNALALEKITQEQYDTARKKLIEKQK